jgi:circadian clock protein KaiC
MAATEIDSTRRQAVSTGVAGLDQLLCGGLTANRMYLIEGTPGAGKTTLGMQFLIEGRERGERCLYVTLSETAAELKAIGIAHGWNLDDIEVYQLQPPEGSSTDDQYTLYYPAEVELGETVKAVIDVIDRLRPSRVVFDSLSEMRLLARDGLRYRRQILALKDFFSPRQCTVLLLDDQAVADADMQLRSIANGVILLEHSASGYGRVTRRIRVIKMRGVGAVEGFHDFSIRRGGLTVYPALKRPAADSPRASHQISSGSAEFDGLLGGGLSWGTTTLVMGPAGAGKSTLAAQFVAAAGPDTRAAIFLFDEGRSTFVARCNALGMNFSDGLHSGRVSIEQINPGDASAGEFAQRVAGAVDAGIRMVFIDTLNGYINALGGHDSDLGRLHVLLSHLNARGAATLLTVAQHGVIGSSMPAPIDVSYLADCVLLLRFFEASGSVRRALSVVKKRTGVHESAIRELQIGPDRIQVGAPLKHFEGVLTGVPRYTGSSDPLLRDQGDGGQRRA